MQTAFFLGVLTGNGFCSFFGDCLLEGRYNYILKGGPGSGKSTAMRRLAESFDFSPIFCASDPDSLDGLLGDKTAVFDGTAPHLLDPSLPGANGEYVVFPTVKLSAADRAGLFDLQAKSDEARARASRFFKAALALRDALSAELLEYFDSERLLKRIGGIVSREFKKLPGEGKVYKRFLEANTPRGPVSLADTVSARKKVILIDSYGMSGEFLKKLAEAGVKNGHNCVTCHDPLDPERINHVIFPDLSLAFIKGEGPAAGARIMRIDALIKKEGLRAVRGKARLLKRVEKELIEDGCLELSKAKKLHDRMEEIYASRAPFDKNPDLLKIVK